MSPLRGAMDEAHYYAQAITDSPIERAALIQTYGLVSIAEAIYDLGRAGGAAETLGMAIIEATKRKSE